MKIPSIQRSFTISSFLITGLVASLGLGLGLSLGGGSQRAIAQDSTGCFMIDASGKTISLGKLCGYSDPSTSGSARASGSGSAAGSVANGVVQVPIKRRSGMTPVIEVTFNGVKTYEMILDTGASGTLITSAMAKELQIQPEGLVKAQIADGSSVEFPVGRMKSIAIQTAKVENVDVAIASDMEIGLLGHDFFGRFDIRIRENMVEFSPR